MSGALGARPLVWVVTECFPRPGRLTHCAFAHRQLVGVAGAGWDVEVFIPNGWYPSVAWRAASGWRAAREVAVPRGWRVGEIPVSDLSYQNRVPSRLNRPLDATARVAQALRRRIEAAERKPDILLVQFALPYGDSVRAAAAAARIPYAVHLRGDDVWIWPHESVTKMDRFVRTVRDAALVLGVSRAMLDEAERLAGPIETRAVVANGIDLAHFAPVRSESERGEARARFGIATGELTLAMVAPAIAGKGWLDLFDALGRLPIEPVTILGAVAMLPDPLDLEREARHRTPRTRLALHRSVTGADVAAMYHAADAFVLPSHSEGMSNAVLEAMAAGLPVVTTRVGGHDEAIEDGIDGALVPAKDVVSLRTALARVLADASLRARWGRAARARAESIGDSRAAGQRLAALLDGACRGAVPPSLAAADPYARAMVAPVGAHA